MKKYTYYIGVDVSKNSLDVFVLNQHESKLFHLCIDNDQKGLKRLKQELKKHCISPQKTLLCLENTGSYAYLVSHWGIKNAFNVWVENAMVIKRSQGLVRGKNDKIDAYRIAMYALRFEDKHTLWQPPRKAISVLQQLNAARKRLINTLTRLKVPLKENALIYPKQERKIVERYYANVFKQLKNSIKKIEEERDQLIKNDPQLAKMHAVITSVDGVGPQIAAALIVSTNEFKHLDNAKSLACYSGVAPFEHTSGISVRSRSRVSHLANKNLKCLLHMGALSALKSSSELREYYDRKVAEGKAKMLVINAIRNKLIARIFACVKQNRMYEKEYVRKPVSSTPQL